MGKMNTLITAFFTADGVNELKMFGEVETAGWGFGDKKPLPATALLERLRKKHVLITEIDAVTKDVIKQAKDLKIIACARGNPVNVDVAAASKYGIPVLNAPARNATSVAELTMAFILILSHKIWPAVLNLLDRNWFYQGVHPYQAFQGHEIAGKTLGVIGFGAVGREVVKRAIAMKMEVLVYDPYVDVQTIQSMGASSAMLSTLLFQSDFVSFHCKVSRETAQMIGQHELSLMKSSAYLINVARAAVINRDALIYTLRNGRIAGAALDVYDKEPLPKDDPLFSLPNVIMTPHIGGASLEVVAHHTNALVQGILNLIRNKKPINLFNPEVWSVWQESHIDWKKSVLTRKAQLRNY